MASVRLETDAADATPDARGAAARLRKTTAASDARRRTDHSSQSARCRTLSLIDGSPEAAQEIVRRHESSVIRLPIPHMLPVDGIVLEFERTR
jgi:hypothetical protein